MTRKYSIIDDEGYEWRWSRAQKRVYMVEAEDTPQNGYYANSWENALRELVRGGYIEPETMIMAKELE